MSLSVFVDDREPPAVAEAVRAHGDVDATEVRRLDAGDLVMGDVAVERKTLADYVNTLVGRPSPDLYDQVRRLSAAFPYSYLLLEDEFPADVAEGRSAAHRTQSGDGDGDEGVPAAAVRGSAASITVRFGTPVIPCSDLDRLVDIAVRLGRKHVEAPGARALPNGSVTRRDAPTAERMYGCIDGVGTATAERLYESYPAVADAVAASREELTSVSGVGPKRADAIRAALRDGE
ncbi:Hef nuclease [Halogeometricum pallidum JCM 14848]|uniref:Hef nuclease n=1 Tax=Halogeometricum pallidum JCM 14848 TaxID=1227487 RepID=M0DF50_HALPD|nr:ERCC4 domain-containing protein [Halogeometricum pallidum]ELZ34070.1 Hef nuclease [Halogeometricum pallidum JCM 14848]